MKRKKFTCPCEVCKAERAKAVQPKQPSRKQLQAMLAEERAYSRHLFQRFEEVSPTLKVGRIVHQIAESHKDAVWTSQDWRRTNVRDMATAHIFFALAKGARGEYGTGSYANNNMAALKAEALRRLIGIERPQL